MKSSEKNRLTEKFWEGETDLNEENTLLKSGKSEIDRCAETAYFSYIAEERKHSFDAHHEIWETIQKRERKHKRILFYTSSIAASILIIISVFIFDQQNIDLGNDNKQLVSNEMKDVYNSLGIDYKSEQTLYINGCKSSYDYHTVFQTISPRCIQKISSTNPAKDQGKKEGVIEVWLKGKPDEVFSVCEGTLYFYQDGEIRTIAIDDECSPGLLVDCEELPLTEIAQVLPHEIKSIEFTTDPRNCNGQMDGEYIVLESK